MAACTGVRVLEVAGGFGAASLCGQLFAGLGAQVIKLEPHAGDALRRAGPRAPDGTAHQFHLVNAAKQSVVLPREAEAAHKRWVELIEWADVVLIEQGSGLTPESVFEPKAFCDQWPSKILGTISAFGDQSARKNWVGNELIAEAMGGVMACTGYPERPPVCSGVPYALHVASLFAFNGIMAALWEQNRSGRGQWLDLSVVDCLIGLLGNFIPSYFLSGRSPKRVGNRHTIAAPWNLYPTSDGYVVICTGTGGIGWWKTITKVIDCPELGADPRYDVESKRVERVDEVDQIVSAWTQRHPTKRVIDLMTAGGIPVSEISSVEEVLADPHYRETRAMIASATVETKGGQVSIPVVGLPLKIGAWSARSEAGPALGQPGFPELVTRANPTSSPGKDRMGRGALQGLRVVEFGSRTSAPMAGRLLADLGADVVKIEPRKGESLRNAGQQIGGSSYIFHINNAGKRSVVIEPTDPRGRELILKLAAQADVWLENLAPGVLERMGLGYSALHAVNPRIIYCSVSGFGHKSNYGDKKAFDAVVQAASGVMYLTGYPDHFPVKIGISASDLAVGVGLVGAVLGALRQRHLNGSGMHVDLAMADIGVWMTQAVWPEIFYGSGHPARLGNRSAVACPHNIFATKDGFIAIGIDTDHQWQQFVRLLGDPALANDPLFATTEGRLKSVDRIEKAVAAWAAGCGAEKGAADCQAVGVPAAPVRNLADIVNDQDVIRRGLIVEVEHPIAGVMKILGNPLQLSLTPAEISSCAPVLGEHTDEVLTSWLGLNAERIEELCAAGVITVQRELASQQTRAATAS